MKILLKHTSIDFSLFHAAVLHETFSVICFCVKDEIESRLTNHKFSEDED